ncbi:MAG: acetyl ornithine aminotransferase family protein [Chloroflexi bacterium]|nr:MAG: acetyl ornithine aminotransferase family protein [Chloroflexota bacterium]
MAIAEPIQETIAEKGPQIITPLPGPRARAIVERDGRVLSPSYTRSYPFVMDHGRGAHVWDVDGNRFIDFTAGIAVVATGHSHPAVVKAIQEQAERFIHMSGTDFYYEVEVRLAERLVDIAPGNSEKQVFLTNSGTEAVEAALKLARYTTGRPRFLSFIGGFHGRTMGSLALTGSKSVQRRGFAPLMPGVTHVPFPNPYRPMASGGRSESEAVIDYIENNLFARIVPPDEVAAVFVEPIQGEGGYVVPPADFFPLLRDFCDRYGILLVADEVQSGMGRTGKWWAIDHWDVEPDIVCVAKGIASGLPLGAMIARKDLMTWGPGSHGNTFGGNPLACAAALTTIDLLEDHIIDNAASVGAYMLGRLAQMMDDHPSIGDVRGKGLMIGVELVKDRETKEPATDLRAAVIQQAFERGVLLLGCGPSTIRFMPPLVIDEETARIGLDIFDQVLAELEAKT